MSWWTDVRDAIEAPFVAIGDFASDVYHGKNLFESTGKFISREVTGIATLSIPTVTFSETDVGQNILNNKVVNALTVGVSGDTAKFSKFALDSANGQDLTWVAARDAYAAAIDGSAKVGAAVLTAGTAGAVASSAGAGTYGVAAATAGGVYAGANGVQSIEAAAAKGDIAALVSSTTNLYSGAGGGDLGIPQVPQSVADAANAAANAVKDAQNAADLIRGAAGDAQGSANQAQSLVDLVKSNTPAMVSGYTGSSPANLATPTNVAVVASAALAVYLLMGRKT